MMKLMRFKWKYLLASLLLANMSACSNDDLTQMSNQQEQDSGTRTAEWFTKTITLDTAGTLEAKLTAAMGGTDVTTLEKLVVSGPFTSTDMTYVRNSLTGLKSIDMKYAVIKASDEVYQYANYNSYFQDNMLPSGMFYDIDNLKEVVLPITITSMGDEVFYRCDSLKSVEIPDGVKTMGRLTFYECISLQSVVLSSGLESIPYGTFWFCRSLSQVTIFDNIKKIEQ